MNAFLTYIKTIWWAVLRRPIVANAELVEFRLASTTRDALVAFNHLGFPE